MGHKKEEWMQFCDCLYASDSYRYIVVSGEKCYKYMCYQSLRELKKRCGEKVLLKYSKYFDFKHYKSVMKEFQSEGGRVTNHPNPENLVGLSIIEQSSNKATISGARGKSWT